MIAIRTIGHNMKIIFPYALFSLFVLTACSDFGFGCKYWILFSIENDPTNSFTMVVCDVKNLIPDLSPQDYSNRMVIQKANALLHSKPELKSCNVIEAPGHTSSGTLIFPVICDGEKPLKNEGTFWKTRYTY